jgi:hypothetical protein
MGLPPTLGFLLWAEQRARLDAKRLGQFPDHVEVHPPSLIVVGPTVGAVDVLREQRAACDLAYRQLNELPLLGLDDQEARQRTAAVLADLRRACDEIGRRPTPVLDRVLSRAILA